MSDEAVADVIRPSRRDVRGRRADQVREDREVVRRKVPDDVDVVLEDAEVHAHGVEVVELPEFAPVDQLLHLPDRARVDEGVVDHQDEAVLLGQGDQLLALGGGPGHRLLDEDVLALLQGPLRELVVGRDGGRDYDRVDLRIVQDHVGSRRRRCPDSGA